MIYGGKAHPKDDAGKAVIRRIFEFAARLEEDLRIVYVENYEMELARSLCAGVDLWLNTPHTPDGGLGHEWDEGSAQRCTELEHPGWMVDGRTCGRRYRLGHR